MQDLVLGFKLKPWVFTHNLFSSGQYYKTSTIVIYDSRVVPDLKLPHITTLES